MKRLILWSILSALSLNGIAQTVNTVTCDNSVTELFKGIYIEMPDLREINSGSKIVVTYDGVWEEDMRGAFEHAVMLWEEVLPLTLPIKITAKIDNISGSGNILSRVIFNTYNYEGDRVDDYASPLPTVKSVLLQEYHTTQRHRFYDEIEDTSILDGNDMTIIYNENLIDQFSFSLDGEPNISKYDFVTVALRDIAMGLGFTTNIVANVAGRELMFPSSRSTKFESLVLGALQTTDSRVAFTNGTNGSLSIPLRNWGNVQFDTLSVYAPQTWVNGTSLRYLIPEDGNPLSQLLTYDFGKGYIVRDLSGIDWNWSDVFCGALDWRRDMVTGGESGSVSQIGSSDDVIPYRGEVSLSFDTEDNAQFMQMENHEVLISNESNVNSFTQRISSETYATTDDYCERFNLYSPNGPAYNGVSLSVLKKDGTWDCVYTGYINQTINLNIESLPLPSGESDYARGTTGGLRYRLTQCLGNYDNQNGIEYYSYRVKYFTRDFTPQSARIKYSKIHSEAQGVAESVSTTTDDYFVDVEIGISNVEGTTRVIVEQLDEGEVLPFQYEVYDFRKGYFVANLDRELSTQLTVISYNSNGYRRSNTINIPPIGYPANAVTFKRIADGIYLDGVPQKLINSGKLSYSLQNVVPSVTSANNETINSDGVVDISNIPNGVYVLTLFGDSGIIGNYKFIK